jgi:hypothetical protein
MFKPRLVQLQVAFLQQILCHEVLEKTGWTQVREKAPTNSVRAELFVPVVRETIDHPTTTFELPTGQGSNVVEISNYAIRPAYPEHRARYEQHHVVCTVCRNEL